MKLLIDVDKETWEFLKNSKENLWWNRGVIISVINGTPIPDNATNDDFFKAVLDEKGYRAIHDRFIGTKWLFAPYRGGE